MEANLAIGGIKEILHNPKHPYTQKLLSTIPKLKEDKRCAK